MVFLKPLNDIKFQDVERLKTNKICESQILDYKEDLIEDRKLVKQVSAFANTQGGFLIFGVKETGRGGYPEEILGVEHEKINKERLEQVILSNTQPRINIRMKEIQIPDTSKSILIIEIPNSYLTPHMSFMDKKFYKRFQNEAVAMDEIEVNDAYRRRFEGYKEIENYIEKLTKHETSVKVVFGQLIVIPTLGNRIIDTSRMEDFDWMNEMKLEPVIGQRYPLLNRIPSPLGIKCEIGEGIRNHQELEIHRNGCVYYESNTFMDYFGYSQLKDEPVFLDWMFCVKLLHTLQVASTLYRKFNYFGDIKLVINLLSLDKTHLLETSGAFQRLSEPSQIANIVISREFPSIIIDSKREWIAYGIMNELYNSFGKWKCPYFNEEGELKYDFMKEKFGISRVSDMS